MTTYTEFLGKKSQLAAGDGFEPVWMPEFLYDFQQYLCEWSIRRGRAANVADCGLGKTPMQLVWAENVVRHANMPVLIFTPLAVAQQTVREAEKFGIDAVQSRDGTFSGKRIIVTNYERRHHFNPADFAGVVCDEASILKSFDGRTRTEVTEFMRRTRHRLLCTATAAPNDYVELGTLAEAIGEMGQRDMITMFFKQETSKDYLGWGRTKYRMKVVIKPKIGAWGLNWQHCNHVVTFASHSYEQYYQSIRRCWRFGQKNPVTVDFVVTEGEHRIAKNLEAKSAAADRMFTAMVRYMNDSLGIKRESGLVNWNPRSQRAANRRRVSRWPNPKIPTGVWGLFKPTFWPGPRTRDLTRIWSAGPFGNSGRSRWNAARWWSIGFWTSWRRPR